MNTNEPSASGPIRYPHIRPPRNGALPEAQDHNTRFQTQCAASAPLVCIQVMLRLSTGFSILGFWLVYTGSSPVESVPVDFPVCFALRRSSCPAEPVSTSDWSTPATDADGAPKEPRVLANPEPSFPPGPSFAPPSDS